LTQLREKGWDIVPVDVGNQVRRFGKQAEIKFQSSVDALGAMKYAAAALDPDDLRQSSAALLIAVGVDGHPSPFLCANVSVLGFNDKYRVVEVAGKKIGFAAIVGEAERARVRNDELEMVPAEVGLQEVLPALKRAQCDHYVLLAHASLEESQELARKFPDFGIVITAGGAAEPPLQPDQVAGAKSYLVQTGHKGMYVGVLGFYDDAASTIRYERVPLDARFPDSKEMLRGLVFIPI
jgi:2',3'-cyclic-nucleotide 2'-phosphodiesterase (5'-nucleotidase family)